MTDTELNAIAPAANMGFRKPSSPNMNSRLLGTPLPHVVNTG
jgi:hypothetical protein